MTEKNKKTPLVVISGPSGSGKTTVCRAMVDEFGLYFSVSHTTRPQRENEVNGVDYFFVSEEDFIKCRDRGDLLEWAKVYDNYYGTSKHIVEDRLKKGQGVIFDVDTVGAANIKKLMPESIHIFIKTPGIDVLKSRLKSRGRDSDQEIEKRVRNAEYEMTHIDAYDYVIVNDKLEDAVEKVREIIKSRT